jgi:hypothetical protein
MAKVSVTTLDKAPACSEPVPHRSGRIVTHALFARERDSIHVHHHHLTAGAALTWCVAEHDLAVYVWKGGIETGGVELVEGSAAIVEQGGSATAKAGRDGATLLTFQSIKSGPPAPGGGRIHLLPSQWVPRTVHFEGREHIGGALYADASCPTCGIWLHENNLHAAEWIVPLHSHSEDEVIFVIDGAIRLGNRSYGPGTAVAVGAGTLYSFATGPDGLSFLNFRSSAPTYKLADGSQSWSEAEKWLSDLGRKPQYLLPRT